MKVLVIGTGVIGTTYSWQLAEAGCELTHLVRKGSKGRLEKEGIRIECLDMRGGEKKEIKVDYHPGFVDELRAEDEYQLILVSVGSNQLMGVLELLSERSGAANILFLQNVRPGEDKVIDKYLQPSQYLFGYPFKAGGGRKGNIISCVIFGNLLTNTMLGEKDGVMTERLHTIYQLMKQAKMQPQKTAKILPYIHSHYVWAAAMLGAFMKAGSYERFVHDGEIIKESYVAMREAFETCKACGIRPDRIAPTSYYYFPLFLLVPFSKRLFDSEEMKRMFEGHVSTSPDEMSAIYYDVLSEGEKYNIDMPVYRSFKKYLDQYLLESGK